MADDTSSWLVQGTLDMLILKTLALEPMHGYGIATRIDQMSQGVFKVNAGSLFPAFCRLERDGWIRERVGGHREQPACAVLSAHSAGTGDARDSETQAWEVT